MNDIDEFRRKEQPKGRRSRLDDHARDILQLRAEGYTLDQIRAFLADRKGVTISRKNLCQWVKRHEGEQLQPQPAQSSLSSAGTRRTERSRPVVTSTTTSGDEQAKQLDAAWQAIHQDESPPPQGSLLDQVKKVQESQSK